MRKIQLYIENVLVDLFDDEIIELTSTIQDVRDIGKVFTDYSQTFTVPASKTNNKIFKHYYNYFITTGAFDSRKKKSAEIHINYSPFRKGKIYLNSVKMKMNKPYAYVLVFYGETVSLKNLIGDDELTDLTYLNSFNHVYDTSTVRSGFKDGLNFLIDGTIYNNSVIYPLITSKKRLFYNSDDPVPSTFWNSDGNLYSNSSSPDSTRGLRFTDLKPAIKTIHIIEAIEDKYNVEFTRDFFSSDAFDNLYMWVNNKKGEYNELDEDEPFLFSYYVTGYSFVSGDTVGLSSNGSVLTLAQSGGSLGGWNISLDIDVNDPLNALKYEVIFKSLTTNKTVEHKLRGDWVNIEADFYASDLDSLVSEEEIQIQILSEQELNINSIDVQFTYTPPIGSSLIANYSTSTNQTTESALIFEDKLPKMKVMDFLDGLFKMFNLTAYYIDDRSSSDYGKIYVDTLDNFYNDAVNNRLGGMIDIDKYLDISNHTIDSLLPFTDINFKYQETDVVLMEHHSEQFKEVFGNSEFNVREAFKNEATGKYAIDRGEKYDIELPFSHLKYERIVDSGGTGGSTDIQWGYSAGGEFNETEATTETIGSVTYTIAEKGDYDSVLIKPLLFYGIRETSISTPIHFLFTNSSGIPDYESVLNYWRPSNANESGTSSTPPSYTLNFDVETDEWQGINYANNTNTLYSLFYKNYVESVFNPSKRMFKVTAHLPVKILLNYKLNDQIKIQDKIFRINSITTNLMTGKSELELLNIFPNEIVQ